MDMMNTVRDLKQSYGDMMNVCKKKLGEEVFDDNNVMDIEFFEMMRGMFRMGDLAMQLVEQQAQTIQEMNNKLDKLLERKDEG